MKKKKKNVCKRCGEDIEIGEEEMGIDGLVFCSEKCKRRYREFKHNLAERMK